MPRISVAMSVYNGERYIEEAIESILNQTYSNFEFIICDDASTDRSIDLVKDYMKNDSRIILIRNERNLGLASSLNNCLSHASGEYIARMDADDISLKDRFQNQIEYLDENPDIAFVCGGVYLFDHNGTWGKRMGNKLLTKENVYRYQPIAHPTAMIRKSVLQQVNGYTVAPYTERGQDFDLWCKIYTEGYEGVKLEDIVLYYREDKNAYRRRRFKYRVDTFKMKKMWRSNLNLPLYYELFAYKPIIVGLIPSFLLEQYHKRKFSNL